MMVEITSESLLAILAILVALVAASHQYNAYVDWLDDNDPDGGYSAFLVVGGVGYTLLAAFAIIGILLGMAAAITALLACVGCFVASGVPMILGDMRRAAKRRQRRVDRIWESAFEEVD